MPSTNGFLPRSLQPWSHQNSEEESLTSILGRIYEERGHFRNITEDSLKAEIASQDDGGADAVSEEEDEEVQAISDNNNQPEKLQAARREMIAHVASAQNEALMALDFVSLLLSRDLPRQAELTMSPFLKQQVKSGTLGMDMWQNIQPDKEREKKEDLLAKGWKMQSLQQSADSLLDAASRLETNVRKETEYWHQVLSVSDRGWSVCRMPREKHNLGVRYGFSEATGEFGHRGLAALRADSEGHVVLDRGLGNNPKAIRVRIQQGAETISVSHVASFEEDTEYTIEARIRHARDSLYEEELFHEITRESRSLLPYGISIDGNTIRLPTTLMTADITRTLDTRHILIDLVPLASTSDIVTDEPNTLAQAIALSFRLLLSHTHRQRLQQRSQVPSPLSLNKPDPPFAQILRPILAILNHDTAISHLTRHIARTQSLLSAASISCDVSNATWSLDLFNGANSVHDLMEKLTSPLHSSATLSLEPPDQAPTTDIRVSIDTTIAEPLFGSRFTVSRAGDAAGIEFERIAECMEHVNFVIAGCLAHMVTNGDDDWGADVKEAAVVPSDAFESSRPGKIRIVIEDGRHSDDDTMPGSLAVIRGDERSAWTQETKQKDQEDFWHAMATWKRPTLDA